MPAPRFRAAAHRRDPPYGYQPTHLRYLVLTHFRADHIGDATDIAQREQATVPAHHADAPFIRAVGAGWAPDGPGLLGTAHLEQVMTQFSAQPRRAAAQITHSGVPIIDAQQIAIAVQNGGDARNQYRAADHAV